MMSYSCSLLTHSELMTFILGKIEINFVKLAPELWSNFGIYERTRTKDVSIYSDCNIVSKSFFNNDSFELILRPKEEQLMLVPIGFHLNFRLLVAGETENLHCRPQTLRIFLIDSILQF